MVVRGVRKAPCRQVSRVSPCIKDARAVACIATILSALALLSNARLCTSEGDAHNTQNKRETKEKQKRFGGERFGSSSGFTINLEQI